MSIHQRKVRLRLGNIVATVTHLTHSLSGQVMTKEHRIGMGTMPIVRLVTSDLAHSADMLNAYAPDISNVYDIQLIDPC